MTPERIAIYAPYFSSTPAGLETYMREVIQHLELNNDVLIYTASPQHAPARFAVRTLPTLKLPGKAGSFARQISRLVWMQRSLALMMQRDQRTVLLSLLHEGMFYPEQRQIMVIHDLMPLIFSHERSAGLVRYYRHLLPRLVKRSIPVAVSDHTRSDMAHFYQVPASKITVIHEAFNRNAFTPDGPLIDGPQNIFYTGTHWPHKNLQRLLSAFARISRQLPHQLVIGGAISPQYTPALQQHAHELHIADRVVWTGYSDRSILAARYRSTDCFIYPSLYEGFGLPPLEAMACGAPVITSAISSIPEVVGDAAILCNPLAVEQLAIAMLAVCTNADYRAQATRRGRKQAATFSWEQTAKQLINLIHS